jgi:hypothetical protein
MSIVVGLQDPGYCESKAIELISEAKLLAKVLRWGEYHEKVSQAISLLALCKVQRADLEATSVSFTSGKSDRPKVPNGPTETEEAAGA